METQLIHFTAKRQEFATHCHDFWFDDDDNAIIDSLERPNLNDQPDISCVPYTQTSQQTEDYLFEYHDSPQLPDCWIVTNMQDGRTGICCHSANFVWQIEGCFAVGILFGELDNQDAILQSKIALEKLKQIVGRDENGKLLSFRLTVVKM